jgi:hypothetical protein
MLDTSCGVCAAVDAYEGVPAPAVLPQLPAGLERRELHLLPGTPRAAFVELSGGVCFLNGARCWMNNQNPILFYIPPALSAVTLLCVSFPNVVSYGVYFNFPMQLVDTMLWMSFERHINAFRVNVLGLQPLRVGDGGWNHLNIMKV